MSRIAKIAASTLLLVPLALSGCGPTKGTASPEDYYPLIQVALAGGETAAMIGRNEAIKDENFAGCVASESLISALDASAQVLSGKLADEAVFPALDVDVSECLPLSSKPPKGHEEAAVLVEAVAGVALQAVAFYAAKLEQHNCKKGRVAMGSISYVQGMVQPVADEIRDPDGKLEIPAVAVDLTCE